ncbi:MAG: hypothetical protein J0M17_10850 [Planctomycetes bacterium]|nr:hypothetical protein [Planctomycetota bacterium]
MNHQDWSKYTGGVCSVLVPSNRAEELELIAFLDGANIRDGALFSRDGIEARIVFPSRPAWTGNGSLKVDFERDGTLLPTNAWFWVVEVGQENAPRRRFVWWATQDSPSLAKALS